MARPRVRWGRFTLWAAMVAVGIATTMTCVGLALGRPLADALVMGGIWGIGQALIQSWNSLRQRKALLDGAPAELTTDQQRLAMDAAYDGPVPSDPAVLAEATRIARARASTLGGDGSARQVAVLFGIIGVALVIAGAFFSHWWFAVAACFAAIGGLTARAGATTATRVTVLREAVAALQLKQ